MKVELREDETIDGPCGLKVIQKKKGYYRYSQDSIQIVDFANVKSKDRVLDLGTGCGIIALLLAKKGSGRKIIGLEIQKELVDIARRNVVLNGFDNKIEIVEGDIRSIKSIFPPDSFDYVISNPPYLKVQPGFKGPISHRAIARHELLCNMGDVLEAMRYVLKSMRKGACVYPASRFVELIVEAKKRGLEPVRVRFVHTEPRRKAELVMVEFVKGGRSILEVLDPIFSTT
ncbi:Release factor glutamine methyltransferase [bacterium HR37]|nr:Release factor glutamine methyltransferase [bacterium HR37]